MGPGAALGGWAVGGRIAMEGVAFTDWAIAAGKLEGEREGGDRMQSSAQPLASDSWQLHFTLYHLLLEGLVVL